MFYLGIMRLFTAIILNEEMKDALIEAQNQMYEGGVSGKYSPEENLHLTLAFIGEYPDAEEVMDIISSVRFTPFDISLDGFGSFGETWWAGISDCPALRAVVRRIRRALADASIPFDRKPFRPHITLVRRARTQRGLPELEGLNAGMNVTAFCLMRSDRGKNGMVYTEVGRVEAEN